MRLDYKINESMPTEPIQENQQPKRWDELNKLLNSNFFIWFLSSIIISGGATLYHNSQQHFETQSNKQKEIINCQFEIVNRLNSMNYLLRRAKTMGDVRYALSSMHKSLGPVIPEYENVNIAALYFKIYQLSGIRNSTIGEHLRELEEMHLSVQTEDPATPLTEANRTKIIELIHTLKEYENQQIIKLNG